MKSCFYMSFVFSSECYCLVWNESILQSHSHLYLVPWGLVGPCDISKHRPVMLWRCIKNGVTKRHKGEGTYESWRLSLAISNGVLLLAKVLGARLGTGTLEATFFDFGVGSSSDSKEIMLLWGMAFRFGDEAG